MKQIEKQIPFEELNLGILRAPFEKVSGGFLHKVYKAKTNRGTYAVKVLNPEIIKRPEAMKKFLYAEKLEEILEKEKIPIVPAIAFDGEKMQENNGVYFYVFPWQEGCITDWNNVLPEQCKKAGEILGKMHAIKTKAGVPVEISEHDIDWKFYCEQAREKCPEIVDKLSQNLFLLEKVQKEIDCSNQSLPLLSCISDEDMDPKNVMWDPSGNPHVIDLECLEYGNPVSHSLQLALQWSGIVTCDLSMERLTAYFQGYASEYEVNVSDYEAAFGVAYTWIDWLEYNLKRALWLECSDQEEQEMGVKQVQMTLDIIPYISQNADRIKKGIRQALSQ